MIFKYRLKPIKGVVYFRFSLFKPSDQGILFQEMVSRGDKFWKNRIAVLDERGVGQRVFN